MFYLKAPFFQLLKIRQVMMHCVFILVEGMNHFADHTVDKSILVVVPHSHTTSGESIGQLVTVFRRWVPRMYKVDASFRQIDHLEQPGIQRRSAICQRRLVFSGSKRFGSEAKAENKSITTCCPLYSNC